MIIKTFAAYISCKQELIDIEIEREEYFQSLPGTSVPGITYSDERAGGKGKSNMSYISDKLDVWDKQKAPWIKYCNQVINLCEDWLLQMDEDTRKIFELRFVDGKTLNEVSESTGYELSWVSRKIISEGKRIKEANFC